ncbi:MAG: TIGR02270 family protein [Oceanospirillaceae bacterium]|nr:TIGR02270 family protein [Oceanospirillaceae bacterium]
MNNPVPIAIIPTIIDRHVEDAAFLWLQRDAAVTEPHYDLKDLAELDERLTAHLDGLQVAGDYAWQVAEQALEYNEPGEIFVAAWLAINGLDGKQLEQVLDLVKDNPPNYRALISALAWHDIEHTQGLLNSFLQANDQDYLCLGMHLCALKRIDPGAVITQALSSKNELLVSRTLRAIGELGRKDLLGLLAPFRASENPQQSFWANWSALLLGDSNGAESLKFHVINGSEFSLPALQLIARALPGDTLKNVLQLLAKNPQTLRLAMQGAGISGDPFWIAGILKYMQTPELARVCGEAFAMITGVDLAYQDLDCDRPEGFESGPSENAEDEDVTLDADEDLPWPDPVLIASWWQQNMQSFKAGTRYLCGEVITESNCLAILTSGYQRQRSAAALELALMGEAFFETRAKGKLQQQLLAR